MSLREFEDLWETGVKGLNTESSLLDDEDVSDDDESAGEVEKRVKQESDHVADSVMKEMLRFWEQGRLRNRHYYKKKLLEFAVFHRLKLFPDFPFLHAVKWSVWGSTQFGRSIDVILNDKTGTKFRTLELTTLDLPCARDPVSGSPPRNQSSRQRRKERALEAAQDSADIFKKNYLERQIAAQRRMSRRLTHHQSEHGSSSDGENMPTADENITLPDVEVLPLLLCEDYLKESNLFEDFVAFCELTMEEMCHELASGDRNATSSLKT